MFPTVGTSQNKWSLYRQCGKRTFVCLNPEYLQRWHRERTRNNLLELHTLRVICDLAEDDVEDRLSAVLLPLPVS